MNPFQYVDSVSSSKKDIMTGQAEERAYNAFMVNRALSYFIDCIMQAQDMNLRPNLPARLQYDFLRISIGKRKRFSKWGKQAVSDDLEMVQRYFNYGRKEAVQALSVLTPAECEHIKERLTRGEKK